jgi:hypothetical protein
VALALALLLPPPDLLPPQPLRAVATIAVPPMATKNPRFITDLLLLGLREKLTADIEPNVQETLRQPSGEGCDAGLGKFLEASK